MALLYQASLIPAFDHNGRIISCAQLHFYLSGTTTRTSIFTTPDETVAHTNPVIANSAGRFPPVYLREKTTHRVRMTDANGILLSYSDVDPINAYDPRAPVVRYYRFGGYVIESPIAGELLVEHIVTDSFTLPGDMAGSVASVEVEPTAYWTMRVLHHGDDIGTVNIDTYGQAMFRTADSQPVAITEGDVVSFVAPAVADPAALVAKLDVQVVYTTADAPVRLANLRTELGSTNANRPSRLSSVRVDLGYDALYRHANVSSLWLEDMRSLRVPPPRHRGLILPNVF